MPTTSPFAFDVADLAGVKTDLAVDLSARAIRDRRDQEAEDEISREAADRAIARATWLDRRAARLPLKSNGRRKALTESERLRRVATELREGRLTASDDNDCRRASSGGPDGGE